MDQQYRNLFDQISLPEDRAQAMRGRLAARCARETPDREAFPGKSPKPFRRSRFLAAAAAAALILSLGTAGATGALQSVKDVFAGLFGSSPGQTRILEEMSRSVGASATADGLTITVDAILGDKANCVIVYSITPEEGVALSPPGVWEQEEDGTEELYLTYSFYDEDGLPDLSYGSLEFYDADPSDPSIQFMEKQSYPQGVPKGVTTRTFENLSYGSIWSGDADLVAAGPWELTFSLDDTDSSLLLAENQAIPLKGETVTADSISISPLFVTIESSFDRVISWREDMSGDPFASHEEASLGQAILSLPVSLTLKDGTTLDLSGNSASSIGDRDGKTRCTRSCRLPEIIPLDAMESLTIGELTIPVEP